MGKRLGQHFLKNVRTLRAIVSALEIQPEETFFEVGAGHGELTGVLAHTQAKIIAIEKDRELASQLLEKFASRSNVEVTQGDILQLLEPITQNLTSGTYKLVGNIPYYVTGRLLRIVGELEHKPVLSVFTLQREVAERITAAPPKMNRLAASVQFWAIPKIVMQVPRGAFRPQPNVDSSVIRLEPRPYPRETEPERYYKIVRTLFQQPRKTVLNNILATKKDGAKKEIEENLRTCGIAPSARPQNLSVENIMCLSDTCSDL